MKKALEPMRKALEPYIKLLPYFGIGLVVVAVIVAWIFWKQKGAHVELVGGIQQVRTLALEDGSSLAAIDFRFRNPSDYPFIVRRIEIFVLDKGGQELEGQVVAEVDAERMFQYFPALGQKFNPSLLVRTKISAGQSMDRMLMARFELPEARLKERKQLRIRIEELDGPVSGIADRPLD